MTVIPKPVVDGLRCQIQSLRDVLHRSALFPRAQDRLVLQPIEGHATGGEGGLPLSSLLYLPGSPVPVEEGPPHPRSYRVSGIRFFNPSFDRRHGKEKEKKGRL